MRGAFDLGHGTLWVEIEPEPEATAWIGRPQFSIVDDPEAGIFDEGDFVEFEQ
jgi:hypothetical protein